MDHARAVNTPGVLRIRREFVLLGLVLMSASHLRAGVGDPQIRTDHPWYPGELACSTFERLAATQAEQYERATGVYPKSDEQKALASWFWRNTHYWHGEEGAEDLWGAGFGKGSDTRSREYWSGLFAHGFGLCGTTHSQWTAEMEYLLGHGRARGVGVKGHNSFEVFLTGGPYGDGQWALLDHDVSTVIFDPEGKRLLSISEVQNDWKRLVNRGYLPEKQHGWVVCGLHPDDGSAYQQYQVAEYLAGYAGVPPMVHLRRGESLRRYFQPGLEDGKTFVFWGRNYQTGKIPGPERSLTWVNQPEKMRGSATGAGHKPGQARYANAVYRYQPDFRSDDYREGVIDESDGHVTFEFYTPFIIGATPPNAEPWGVYDNGGRNGLLLRGKANCKVAVSVDQGKTWKEGAAFHDGLDLTDLVKGHRQYFLKFETGAKSLAESDLTITTVCQVNGAVLPRLKEHGSQVEFLASGRAVVSAGPNRAQAKAHLVGGGFDTPALTLEMASPRNEPVAAIHAAAHIASGNPPQPDVKYQIEYSLDGGKTWQAIVRDWIIPRRGDEPKDFWSQSMCYGAVDLPEGTLGRVQVRYTNNRRKNYLRAEAHLVYPTRSRDDTKVSFAWHDSAGSQLASHVFAGATPEPQRWKLNTASAVETRWVEFQPVVAGRN